VILAGGTMAPFDDYTTHLFPYLPAEKITTLSCGHVIPKENLSVWTLGRARAGDASSTFEFSFQRRGDKGMINDLGVAILNMCSVIPDGVVAFFPSYGYLDEVVKAWQEKPPNAAASVWDRLGSRKELFRESKGGSSDEILEAYTNAILSPSPNTKTKGALLLSVVGGKMSEGINFSDRLGRCVLIIGLPYPNMNSPDWKARIEYIETTTISRLCPSAEKETPTGTTAPGSGTMSKDQATVQAKNASRAFYENSCMRAVNQSIGRAIRHRGDYAAIILVDRRYATSRIRGKLPGWIAETMAAGSEEGEALGRVMGGLSTFFRGKSAS